MSQAAGANPERCFGGLGCLSVTLSPAGQRRPAPGSALPAHLALGRLETVAQSGLHQGEGKTSAPVRGGVRLHLLGTRKARVQQDRSHPKIPGHLLLQGD